MHQRRTLLLVSLSFFSPQRESASWSRWTSARRCPYCVYLPLENSEFQRILLSLHLNIVMMVAAETKEMTDSSDLSTHSESASNSLECQQVSTSKFCFLLQTGFFFFFSVAVKCKHIRLVLKAAVLICRISRSLGRIPCRWWQKNWSFAHDDGRVLTSSGAAQRFVRAVGLLRTVLHKRSNRRETQRD